MTCAEYVIDVSSSPMVRRKVESKAPRTDVAAVRRHLGLSQGEFAEMFGISQGTVEQWEQGRREPTGPARVLLAVLDQDPDAVLAVLDGRRRRK